MVPTTKGAVKAIGVLEALAPASAIPLGIDGKASIGKGLRLGVSDSSDGAGGLANGMTRDALSAGFLLRWLGGLLGMTLMSCH